MNEQPSINAAAFITKEQLASIGVNLPDEQIAALIQHIEDSASNLIVEEVLESLTAEQLKELESLQESGASDEQINNWFRSAIPEYDNIIEDNVTIILGELAENADKL
ncbi:MAG: DUF5663 domain-containing protein [Candidatus Saccharibacteria bacterium]|nr:DUF5663 domain-containing protein [Candidatus Saccharibacteria bacterium]